MSEMGEIKKLARLPGSRRGFREEKVRDVL